MVVASNTEETTEILHTVIYRSLSAYMAEITGRRTGGEQSTQQEIILVW